MSGGAARSEGLRHLLEQLVGGEATLDETVQKLRMDQVAQVGGFARLDLDRDLRKGVPEVVYAFRKSDRDLEAIVRRYLNEKNYVLATRLEPGRAEILRQALAVTGRGADTEPGGSGGPIAGLTFAYQENAGVLAAYTPAYKAPEARGCVGLLTAGTSDIPVAEEAALMITHMGCRIEKGYDTGVAGLHRLAEPLTRMLEAGADVLVVVAGMEGALPSVVAGLVDVPVIGVPTSTGYGLGGDGTAALYSILQSCSPGLVAVNIDNGVGAGVAAALIARGRRG
jgi:NCAIR mutase (PurE)-related protein